MTSKEIIQELFKNLDNIHQPLEISTEQQEALLDVVLQESLEGKVTYSSVIALAEPYSLFCGQAFGEYENNRISIDVQKLLDFYKKDVVEGIKLTLFHEVGHEIQDREDWPLCETSAEDFAAMAVYCEYIDQQLLRKT